MHAESRAEREGRNNDGTTDSAADVTEALSARKAWRYGRVIHSAYTVLRKVNAWQHRGVQAGSGALASRQAVTGVAVQNTGTFSRPLAAVRAALSTARTQCSMT